MLTNCANAAVATMCMCAVFTGGQGVAQADSLDATMVSAELYPGELVIIDMVLTLDCDGEVASTNPADQARAHALVHRKLDATLLLDGTTVATFPLFGPEFRKTPSGDGAYRTTVTGLPTRRGDEARRLELVTSPGNYELVVRDRHSASTVASKPVALAIRQPRDEDAAALEEYKRLDPAQLAVALYSQEGGSQFMEALAHLVAAHPNTVYGAYASSVGVLRECEQRLDTQPARGDDAGRQELAAKLRVLSGHFGRGHPIREELLLNEALIEAGLGQVEQARAVIEILKRDFPNGARRDRVQKLDEKLQQ